MTGTDDLPGGTPDELRELAPAYALGALDEADRRRFERALATSPELQAEVETFRVTASMLGDSQQHLAPPPSLKTELFARLDTVEREGSSPCCRRRPRSSCSSPASCSQRTGRARTAGAHNAS